jgi:hypothetical protein
VLRDDVDDLGQLGELALVDTEELQIHEQQIERRVADALADAQDGAVHAICAGLDRRQRVPEPEPPVVVSVPVDARLRSEPTDELLREVDHVEHAVRRRVPTVSHTQRPSAPSSMAAVNRRRSVVGCERVVSSVTNVHVSPAALAFVTDVRVRSSRSLRPTLRVEADGRRAEEGHHLDVDPDALGHVDDRLDVGRVRPRSGLRLDAQLLRPHELREHARVLLRARARRRKTHVHVVDAQLGEQSHDPLLGFDRRIGDRRRLDAVAQGLVDVRHAPERRRDRVALVVPVEDDVGGDAVRDGAGSVPSAADITAPRR